MKKLIYIMYLLLFSFAFVSCDDNEDVLPTDLTVGFLKSRLDVGENSGLLEIPLVVKGARADVALDLVANFTAKDGSAVSSVDYELVSKSLTLTSAGSYVVQVKIMDNNEVPPKGGDYKNFTISLASVVGNAKTKISEIEISIVENDLNKKYTLKAYDLDEKADVASVVGSISIEEDGSGYRIVNGNYLDKTGYQMFLSSIGDILIEADANGNLFIPTGQNLGSFGMEEFGYGEAMIITLDAEGKNSMDPCAVTIVDGNFVLASPIACYFPAAGGSIYFLSNMVFELVK